MSKPAPRREMTEYEKVAVECLQHVRYPPCSWDKRFARHMAEQTQITDKEAPQVWRLILRYRRQWHGAILKDNKQARGALYQNLLEMGAQLSAPDLRKVAAAARESAQIREMKEKYAEAMKQ